MSAHPDPRSRMSCPAAGHRAAGFTLIELVVVILLMAIMLTVAAPRFFSRNDFEGPAYAQELASAARYAQKLAISSGCPVQFVVAAASYVLQQPANADCSGAFDRIAIHPATGGNFSGTAPVGLSTGGAPATVAFNSRGIPDAGRTFTMAGRTVGIEAGSGYVDVQ